MHVYRLLDSDGRILLETTDRNQALDVAANHSDPSVELEHRYSDGCTTPEYNGNNYGHLRFGSREILTLA